MPETVNLDVEDIMWSKPLKRMRVRRRNEGDPQMAQSKHRRLTRKT